MIPLLSRLAKDERGQSLALMAVMAASVIAFLSLAIDHGMLRGARAEAQRAADSAALAGAQQFLRISPPGAAVPTAYDSAMAFARKNAIRNVPIDSSEVTIQVILADQKVWVRIERQGLALWFAKLLGRQVGTVNAAAAARAMPAAAARCVAPFALPDMWAETNPGEDLNANRVWDVNEAWTFGNSPTDYYRQNTGDTTAVPPETGYGSRFRNNPLNPIDPNPNPPTNPRNDWGRQQYVKMQDPQQAPTSGFFYPYRIGTNQGAQDYRNAIQNCDTQPVPLNQNVPLEMGNMVGPTRQGIQNVIGQDPNAVWDPTVWNPLSSSYGTVINSNQGANWINSPRVKIVALFDPNQIATIHGQASGGGQPSVKFNNFALFFIEGLYGPGNQASVVGRFLYYAPGVGGMGGANGNPGSLVRILQLVE